MLHRVRTKTLNRTAAHRKALLKNLSDALIQHERVETTLTKAKYFKPYVEKLITKAKKVDKENKIQTFNTVKYLKARLNSEESVKKLIDDLGPRFKERNGGYTKLFRIGNRGGDNSMMARIELVETAKKKTEEKDKEALKKSVKKVSKGEAKVAEVKDTKENTNEE